jgi:hypothetical protein
VLDIVVPHVQICVDSGKTELTTFRGVLVDMRGKVAALKKQGRS